MTASRDDLFCDVTLCSGSIDGNHRPRYVYVGKDFRNGRDLIGFVLHFLLCQAKAVLAYPSIEDIQAFITTECGRSAALLLPVYNYLFSDKSSNMDLP